MMFIKPLFTQNVSRETKATPRVFLEWQIDY